MDAWEICNLRVELKGGAVRDFDVTSAGISAEQERHHRMKVYFIMMSIRMASVMSLIWLRGWWILIAVIGGVVLPYLAVVFANQPKYTDLAPPMRPDPLQLTGQYSTDDATAAQLIVIDDPADRRRAQAASPPADDVPIVEPEYLTREDDAE